MWENSVIRISTLFVHLNSLSQALALVGCTSISVFHELGIGVSAMSVVPHFLESGADVGTMSVVTNFLELGADVGVVLSVILDFSESRGGVGSIFVGIQLP